MGVKRAHVICAGPRSGEQCAQLRRVATIASFSTFAYTRRKLGTPAESARITARDCPTDRKLSKVSGRSVQAIQQTRLRLRKSSLATDSCSSTAVATHEVRFAHDMALHGTFEVWFAGPSL